MQAYYRTIKQLQHKVYVNKKRTKLHQSEMQVTVLTNTEYLTLKAPSKVAADDTLLFLLLSFEENKA